MLTYAVISIKPYRLIGMYLHRGDAIKRIVEESIDNSVRCALYVMDSDIDRVVQRL